MISHHYVSQNKTEKEPPPMFLCSQLLLAMASTSPWLLCNLALLRTPSVLHHHSQSGSLFAVHSLDCPVTCKGIPSELWQNANTNAFCNAPMWTLKAQVLANDCPMTSLRSLAKFMLFYREPCRLVLMVVAAAASWPINFIRGWLVLWYKSLCLWHVLLRGESWSNRWPPIADAVTNIRRLHKTILVQLRWPCLCRLLLRDFGVELQTRMLVSRKITDVIGIPLRRATPNGERCMGRGVVKTSRLSLPSFAHMCGKDQSNL